MYCVSFFGEALYLCMYHSVQPFSATLLGISLSNKRVGKLTDKKETDADKKF